MYKTIVLDNRLLRQSQIMAVNRPYLMADNKALVLEEEETIKRLPAKGGQIPVNPF